MSHIASLGITVNIENNKNEVALENTTDKKNTDVASRNSVEEMSSEKTPFSQG